MITGMPGESRRTRGAHQGCIDCASETCTVIGCRVGCLSLMLLALTVAPHCPRGTAPSGVTSPVVQSACTAWHQNNPRNAIVHSISIHVHRPPDLSLAAPRLMDPVRARPQSTQVHRMGRQFIFSLLMAEGARYRFPHGRFFINFHLNKVESLR